MINNQNLLILKQIRPLLAQLILALGELPPFEQVASLCIEGTDNQIIGCLVTEIEAYGVTIDPSLRSNITRLRQILSALETVGNQIAACLVNCVDTPRSNITVDLTTASSAFQAVFRHNLSSFSFAVNAELENEGRTLPIGADGATADGNNPMTRVIIQLDDEFINERDDPLRPTTVEGIIRHELGHVFLDLFRLSSDPSLRTYYDNNIIADFLDATDSVYEGGIYSPGSLFPDSLRNQDYLPNAIRAQREINSEGSSPDEDFADVFSYMGRFVEGNIFFDEIPDENFEPRVVDITLSFAAAREEAKDIIEEGYSVSRDSINIREITLRRIIGTGQAVYEIILDVTGENGVSSFVVVLDAQPDPRHLQEPDRLFVDTEAVYTNSRTRNNIQEDRPWRPRVRDRQLVESNVRTSFFTENFCCWLAELLANDCLC